MKGGEIAETSGQERVRPQNFTQEVGIDLPGILDKENKESIQFKNNPRAPWISPGTWVEASREIAKRLAAHWAPAAA